MPGKDLSELRDLIPENGDTSWDGPLNEVLEGILDDIEPDVRASEIDIDADLDVNGYSLTEVGAVQLENVDEELDSPTDTLKLYSFDGELHYTDGSANVVRVTLDGVLDVSSAGGIAGDYGDSGSNVSYSDISKLYTFEQGSGLTAHIRVDQLQLQNGASATRVTLEAPSSLSASYTWTLPTALPASTSLVEVTSTGQLGNATSATLTGTATIGTLAVTGTASVAGALTVTTDVSVGDDLTVAGDIDLTGSATVETNLTVEGVATLNEWAFPERELSISSCAGQSNETGFDDDGQWLALSSTGFLVIPISLHSGDTVESIDYRYRSLSAGSKAVRIVARNGSVLTSTIFTTNTAGAWTNATLSSIEETVSTGLSGANQGLFFRFEAATSGDGIAYISVHYRRDA